MRLCWLNSTYASRDSWMGCWEGKKSNSSGLEKASWNRKSQIKSPITLTEFRMNGLKTGKFCWWSADGTPTLVTLPCSDLLLLQENCWMLTCSITVMINLQKMLLFILGYSEGKSVLDNVKSQYLFKTSGSCKAFWRPPKVHLCFIVGDVQCLSPISPGSSNFSWILPKRLTIC